MPESTARPPLLVDVDGVLNFDATKRAFRARNGSGQSFRQKHLLVDGVGYRVRWSIDVVRRLNTMHRRYGFEWLWLTTWRSHARHVVGPALGTADDGHISWKQADGQSFPGHFGDPNGAAKPAHVERLNGEEARPFVWVDDEAIRWFDASRLRTPVPHLNVQPDPMWGLESGDLDRMEEFFAAHPWRSSEGDGR